MSDPTAHDQATASIADRPRPVCGPCFTPDGQTLFVAVQHPAEGSERLEKANTRWPDFDPKIPPRPAIVVITRDGGGEIGV